MEFLGNMISRVQEMTSAELQFVIVAAICLLQTVVLGILWGGRYKIRRKYFNLTQDFQLLQLSLQSNNGAGRGTEQMGRTENAALPAADSGRDNALYTSIYKELQRLMEEDKLYHDPRLTRDEVVAKLGTSRKIFLEALQRNVNMSFVEYTNKYRLDEAIELLENGEYTNEIIAEEVGFGSVNTFYRQFRQKYGISPLEYRKALNENLVASVY